MLLLHDVLGSNMVRQIGFLSHCDPYEIRKCGKNNVECKRAVRARDRDRHIRLSVRDETETSPQFSETETLQIF